MKAIDWSKWSAVAEILSAITILVTLLYLSIQTRYLAIQTEQNTQAIMAATAQGVIERESGAISYVVEFPEIFVSFTNPELTDDEAIRLHSFLAILLRVQESYWEQYKLGVVDQATMERYQASLTGILSYERTRNWWTNMRVAFDPSFADSIDNLLANRVIRSGTSPENIKQLFERSR